MEWKEFAQSHGFENADKVGDEMAKAAGAEPGETIPALRAENKTALELFFRWEQGGFHMEFDSLGIGHSIGFDWNLLYGWAQASGLSGEQFEVMEKKFQMLESVVLELRGAESRRQAEAAAAKARGRSGAGKPTRTRK